MDENGSQLEGEAKPPYVEEKRSSVRNAFTKTAKTLFPMAGIARLLLREDLEEVYQGGTAKKIKAGVTAFGGLVDVARMAGIAGLAINAAEADSAKSVIKFSLLIAGAAITPYLFKSSIEMKSRK